jgi:hypothetical protein
LFFVLANFGIAIAAKMPMMTTTISSSMSVKPFRARKMDDMKSFSLGDMFGEQTRLGMQPTRPRAIAAP